MESVIYMSSQKGEPMGIASAALPVTKGLSQLFGEHHRRVLLAAYRVTGSMADAEDVAQSVFLRLAASGAPPMNASSYLYRAALNGALDLLRRRATASAEAIEEAADLALTGTRNSPEGMASNQQLGDMLRVAIGELAPRAAEMFTMRYLEERDNREIATLMGTSQAVVAVTLHHARSRLKKRLTELERGKR
jgi:RNA polymerase sigma-70 factor (ECF subfamily)